MEQRRRDGRVVLTNSVTCQQMLDAANDERNAVVAVHREGSTTTDSRGRVYAVNALGQWVRVSKRHKKRPTTGQEGR